MTDALPDPLVPPEVDLRDFQFTPIFRARLFGSSFHARSSDAEWRAGVTLWMKSWDQVPAGTLPDDDIDLCRLAEFGRDMKGWAKVRAGALHGWCKCTDGRLHHAVVAQGVLEAWGKRKSAKHRGAQGGAAKWGAAAREAANKQTRAQRLADARELGTHTPAEWDALLWVCGGVCLRCNEHGELVKDHVKPLYQGGSDGIDNIQPMCRTCNAAKGPECIDHRPKDWLERLEKRLAQPRNNFDKCLEGIPPAPTKGQGIEGTGKGQGEGSNPPLPPSNGKAKKRGRQQSDNPGTTIPEGFLITEEMEAWALSKGLSLAQIDLETEAFIAWHKSQGSLYVDWDAAWHTRIIGQIKRGLPVSPPPPKPAVEAAEQSQLALRVA